MKAGIENEIVAAWLAPAAAGLSENCRKLTAEQHAELFGPACPMPARLEIDQVSADPIHDHRPQSRAKSKVKRVLAILDELEKENSNREGFKR